jgi:hypothetical protein
MIEYEERRWEMKKSTKLTKQESYICFIALSLKYKNHTLSVIIT